MLAASFCEGITTRENGRPRHEPGGAIFFFFLFFFEEVGHGSSTAVLGRFDDFHERLDIGDVS